MHLNRLIRRLLFSTSVVAFAMVVPVKAQFNALVWSDEFDYTGLPSATKWSFEEGGNGWGNNELQYYTANRTENARVENGVLIIEAHKESYNGRDYTSARLNSTNKGDWLYGRFEIRARVPGGKGTWPAIWMLPTEWAYGNWPASGEIDIMEHVGYDPLKIYGTAHTEAYNHKLNTQKGGSVTGSDWESAFHVYAIEWSAEKIDFIIDGNTYFTFRNEGTWQTWPFDKRFHFILNVAVGGSWGGAQGVDPTIFPKRMEIDYVRVYQSANLSISGPAYLENNEQTHFQATRFTGATYDWQVPADATITAGQGTDNISVRWGSTEGEVRCSVRIGESTFSTANYIKGVIVPAEPTFWFSNLTDGNLTDIATNISDGSSYTFSESGESLKVVYQTVNPATWPRFTITLPKPVNLKTHPYCVVNLKTWNLSRSVTVRFDFADVNGVETNATPVFRPVITADGRFRNYQNNFTGRWTSSSPLFGQKVDSTRIIRLTTYVNGGVFGIANKTDSLWIESIRFLTAPLTGIETPGISEPGINIFPNPASGHLTVESDKPIETIELLDLTGKMVKLCNGNNQLTLRISTGEIPPGMYVARCTLQGDAIRFEKIVIR